MAELKTKKTAKSVEKFLNGIADEKRRKECFAVLELMKQATGYEPKMWGSSIVGFGEYHYKYESGREGDWFFTGFSPRKQNLTIYLLTGFNWPDELVKKLGKHKKAASCLYIKNLDDIHLPTLKRLVKASEDHLKKVHK